MFTVRSLRRNQTGGLLIPKTVQNPADVVGVTAMGSVGMRWFCWVGPDGSSPLCRLRERHQDVLRQKLYKLKQEQGVESEPLFPIIKQEPASPSDRYAALPLGSAAVRASPCGHWGQKTHPRLDRPRVSREQGYHPRPSSLFSLPCRLDPEESIVVQPGPSSEPEAEQDTEAKGEAEGEAVLMEEDLIQQSLDDYDAGKYSPRLLGTNELPFDAHVLEAEEDAHRLLLLRQQLQVTGRSPTLRPCARRPHGLPGAEGCACASGCRAGGGRCPQKRVSESWIWSTHPEPAWHRDAPGSKGCCGLGRSREMGLRHRCSLWVPTSHPSPLPVTPPSC